MRSELCTRCGSCVALGKGKISIADREGKYLPEIHSPLDEKEASEILKACPAWEFKFPEFNKKIFPRANAYHPYLGSYESIFIGHVKDEKVRRNAASGGILSGVLIHLLKTGQIDGVITTRMSHRKPWLTESFLATTEEDILEAAQSKYIITSTCEYLSETWKLDKKLAFVGLPAQVQSVRKMQDMHHPLVENIRFIFGPFYGNTLYFSSVKSFLKSHGEKDYRDITKLYFRYGEWPGNMRVEMKSGRVLELKKFHANYLIPFHILKNSLYCTDFSNEFTDLSGGDAWAPVYEERGKGFSIIITRSKEGDNILKEMNESGKLELSPIEAEEAIQMHSHGYDFKKRGSFIRMKFRKWRGGKIPDWGYKFSGFKFSRYLMEAMISFLFLILGTRLASFFIELFSPAFIGKIFEKTRTLWKKSTSSVKRKELG